MAGAAGSSFRDTGATCRGLLFVQLYGVYEYAVGASVQAALDFVRGASLSCQDVRSSLLSLVLDAEWMRSGTVGRRRRWDVRLDLIEQMNDTAPLSDLRDSLFPDDGTHYRTGQLITIWKVFGITLPIVPQPRLLGRIDELVENRNAIAHGRRTARDVGGGHSDQDMQDRIVDTQSIASHVVDTMDAHCSSGGLLR